MAPNMPPDYWWVTGVVVFILALTATVDAFTATIPELLIFLGLLAVVGTQGRCASWEIAAQHLQQAVIAGLLIWAINFAWYCKFDYDALGMGDAKWTMLAVACFGVTPVLFAWGFGAVLAVIFMEAVRLVGYRISRVTFSPFLFISLGVGLYWVRFW
ncbi:MAG: prepilin peptidase [Alphaproteobacteria bacterium]|nr:prepilin peptidase [Alphaproteobacteria bacterium]